MQPSVFLARVPSFSTLDSVFAASVALGFAFSLLLVLSSGRFPRLRLFRIRRIGRIRPIGPMRSGRPTFWHTVPGAIPVAIGAFLIGLGLFGLALKSLAVADWGRVLMSGAFGTLFSTLFLAFVAHYFGGGAREEAGGALVGAVARVSLDIPSDGTGRIAFERAGRRVTMPARSHDGYALSRGASAFVVGVVAGTALVEEL